MGCVGAIYSELRDSAHPLWRGQEASTPANVEFAL